VPGDANRWLVHLREAEHARHPRRVLGLLTVIVIGLVVENLIFRTIERLTVKKWGLQI